MRLCIFSTYSVEVHKHSARACTYSSVRAAHLVFTHVRMPRCTRVSHDIAQAHARACFMLHVPSRMQRRAVLYVAAVRVSRAHGPIPGQRWVCAGLHSVCSTSIHAHSCAHTTAQVGLRSMRYVDLCGLGSVPSMCLDLCGHHFIVCSCDAQSAYSVGIL